MGMRMRTICIDDDIHFVDAALMGLVYPATFEAPGREALDGLRAGCYVKVCLNAERFRIKVEAVEGETIRGTVANDLVLNDLPCDSPIACEKRHVYAVLTNEG
jgi:hypothetical protein